MKITIETTLEGKVVLETSCEVKQYADMHKLGKKLMSDVTGIRKVAFPLFGKKIERVRIVAE